MTNSFRILLGKVLLRQHRCCIRNITNNPLLYTFTCSYILFLLCCSPDELLRPGQEEKISALVWSRSLVIKPTVNDFTDLANISQITFSIYKQIHSKHIQFWNHIACRYLFADNYQCLITQYKHSAIQKFPDWIFIAFLPMPYAGPRLKHTRYPQKNFLTPWSSWKHVLTCVLHLMDPILNK
jgi:hypothetical protein